MLTTFWSRYTSRGVHPADERFINASNSIRWRYPLSARRTRAFDDSKSLHGLLHLSLVPQPFLGNIATASIYILMANPGLSLDDYHDDFANAAHAAASEANLRQQGVGFYPLSAASDGTGAANYWRSSFGSLKKDIARELAISQEAANDLLVREMAVIEAGAYHSKSFPGDWIDRLPSSRVARRFVRHTVLERASRNDALVLVHRRAAFWRISPGPGVIHRAPKKAQLARFLGTERSVMVDFLKARFA